MNTPSLPENVAASKLNPEFTGIMPLDKQLDPAWVTSLAARGEPERFSGDDLRFIGMPVGGLFCGTLYLGGDGRLWLWDIFNAGYEGVIPDGAWYGGKRVNARDGGAYVTPPLADGYRVVKQGFKLAVKTSAGEIPRTLDADKSTGFAKVTFTGEYPIGVVTYEDPQVPVRVKMEAFSPFIPLDVADSSLPATIFEFTATNTGGESAEIALTGFLENAVLHHHPERIGQRVTTVEKTDGLTALCFSTISAAPASSPRGEILFEDWAVDSFEKSNWKYVGKAFGKGPCDTNQPNRPVERTIASAPSAPGIMLQENEAESGRLTSQPFVIDRSYIVIRMSGGIYPESVSVNLLVDGKIVRSMTGPNTWHLVDKAMDVRELQGRIGVLEIVDHKRFGWATIGVGRISFSDECPASDRTELLHDFGTVGLALLGAPAEIQDGGDIGQLGRKVKLAPGESTSIRFILTWHFPNVTNLLGGRTRHYAERFSDAQAVTKYVADHFERLAGQTKLWRDTWYDSTLPHWFLNRTFANTSILATTTAHRFDDGRFWAWEGIGCCAGTCTHVWHYAQAMGRLFPEVERDHRERVDFGLALHKGVIHFRAEDGNDIFAIDGQAGRILGAYREHQMSTDDAFLRRVWPRVKIALDYIISHDTQKDGILKGPLHNTLDADWYGVVPWLCGIYFAALRAGEEMATEVGDTEFAATCHAILEVGAKNLDALCWNPDFRYYIHLRDEAHPNEVGGYDGCHIDQVLGQSWAWQVGLGRVMTEAHVKDSLRALWLYNFSPDVGPYRKVKTAGRWYAMDGDAGLLMMTQPFAQETEITGAGAWATGYFNECMSGFEHQVASHMIWEGMVTEGLAITRAIHDRYRPQLRNPYNEIECSDHYARAMASYGSFLAASGFEYHGPHGHLGFAPRLTPEHFKSAFTTAEGWGTYEQTITNGELSASIALKWGRLVLKTLSLASDQATASGITASLNGQPITAEPSFVEGRLQITFPAGLTLTAGSILQVKTSA